MESSQNIGTGMGNKPKYRCPVKGISLSFRPEGNLPRCWGVNCRVIPAGDSLNDFHWAGGEPGLNRNRAKGSDPIAMPTDSDHPVA